MKFCKISSQLCRYFREMRDREKHRMEHTEIYSTALWHLQEDVEFSALAQELTKVTYTARWQHCFRKYPKLHLYIMIAPGKGASI